jgi:hypothetical protein
MTKAYFPSKELRSFILVYKALHNFNEASREKRRSASHAIDEEDPPVRPGDCLRPPHSRNVRRPFPWQALPSRVRCRSSPPTMSATFQVTTTATKKNSFATLSASYNGVTKATTITVKRR